MSVVQFLSNIKLREDDESAWETVNPVLLKGEIGVVPKQPPLFKIGEGSTPWSDLPFYTNHDFTTLDYNYDIQELFNPIHLTTYLFTRLNKDVTDLVFLMDSFRDSRMSFRQCDGRVHKIVIANESDTPMYVEVSLSGNEQNEGTILRDFGTGIIAPKAYGLIEYFWIESIDRVCICRFTEV